MREIDEAIKNGQAVVSGLSDVAKGNFFIREREWLGTEREIILRECCFFQIEELTFEEKAPRREAMENVLSTFRDLEGMSFIYLILGSGQDVKFYFGIAKDFAHEKAENLSAPTIGGDLLKPSIQGNFRGCQIRELTNADKREVIKRLKNISCAGILTGVPGTEKDNENFQGVDRLINVMAGDEFGFMVIARPLVGAEVNKLEDVLIEIADALSPIARHSFQRTKSTGTASNSSVNTSNGTQITESTQESKNSSSNKIETTSQSEQKNISNQQQATAGQTSGRQHSISSSSNSSERNANNKNLVTEKDNNNVVKKSEDENKSKEQSGGISSGANYSAQNQTSYVFGYQVSSTDNTSKSTQTSESASQSTSENISSTTVENKTNATTESTSSNTTQVEQMEVDTKTAAQWIKYIDEILFPRLDCGRGKGLFLCCAYLFAAQPAMLHRLANTAISLYSGTKGNRRPLSFHEFSKSEAGCLHALQNMQIPSFLEPNEKKYSAILSSWTGNRVGWCGNWFSVEELSVIAALPKKEIPGLALREEVEFGLNFKPVADEYKLPLGNLVQDGTERNLPVSLDRRDLNKHTFITGVTGSGKTTTCQNILINSGLPFLVIEPAKTEYRILKERCPELIFFTPGKQNIAPFFLNPFELFPGEAITGRADMIKATLEASFDMEAAIPQILETGVYRAYEEKGWDIRTNEWRPSINGNDELQNPFDAGVYPFPTMSDFWEAVKKVTKEEGFGERLQDEYMGSLKARIESLLVGAKGMMFDTARSINFFDLVERKVVIELEEIKNGSEKSLLMGFILTNLLQAVQYRHRKNPAFQHITLIEEAHRLLSRYVPGDSMNKKQGVEVFSDMLAEVRKYGESLIIVDQIPDKMTPEVLKNTNTKIVHKLFARDDKDAIGDTIALSDEQKTFLSKLPTGRAIIFSQGQVKAMQVKIKQEVSTTEQREIEPEEIRDIAENYYTEPKVIASGVLRGIEHFPAEISKEIIRQYLWIMRGGYSLKKKYRSLFDNDTTENALKTFQREVNHVEKTVGRDVWQTWLFCNLYEPYDQKIFEKFCGVVEEILSADDDNFDSVLLKIQREIMGVLRLKGGN